MNNGKKIFGSFLKIVGILVMCVSGLCSLALIGDMNDSGAFGLVMVFGGIPFAIGLGFFLVGKKLTADQGENLEP